MQAEVFVSHIEVPKSTLLCAMFHEDEPMVQSMRAKLVAFNPNFFSLDDMPRENMAPPMSAEELVNSGADRIKVHPNFVLTLWYTLKQMREPESFWRPYFDMLPAHIPTPLSWSEEELQVIKGTNLYEGLPQLRCLLKKVWSTLNRVDDVSYTLEEVEYCWTLFTSRAFTVSTDTSRDEVHTHIMKYNQSDQAAASSASHTEPALVPFADLFNHDVTAIVKYRTNNLRQTFNLDIQTLKQNGQEIFNNYGAKSNESLIVGYGFTILDTDDDVYLPESNDSSASNGSTPYTIRRQSNPHNTYWVQINIDERDNLRSKKLRLLEKRGIPFRHHIPVDGTLPSNLLDAVRICMLDNIELYFLDAPLYDSTELPTSAHDPSRTSNSTNGSTPKPGVSTQEPPIPSNFDAEMLLYDTLGSLITARLDKMEPTPAQHDRTAFLKAVRNTASPLSWPTIMGWQYRVEQKEILESALSQVDHLRLEYLKKKRTPEVLDSQVLPPSWDSLTHLPEAWQERFKSWLIEYDEDEVPQIENEDLIPVLRIPYEYILCRETLRQSPIGMIINAAGLLDGLDEELLLAIAVLFHLHTPGQAFHDYFQAIAVAYLGRPKYLNAPTYDSQDLLEETPAEAEMQLQSESYRGMYRDPFLSQIAPLHPNFQDQNMFGWRQFAWAFSLVTAEALMVPYGDDMILGIIPSYGLRKTHPQESCDLVSDDDGRTVSVRTSRTFPAASTAPELPGFARKYGFYSGCQYARNEEILRTYGVFVAGPHNMDVVTLPLFAHEEDDSVDLRMSCLTRLHLNTEHFLDSRHAPQQLVSSLKVLSMPRAELQAMHAQIVDGDTSVSATTRAAENALVDRILTLMETMQRGITSHERKKKETSDKWLVRRYDAMIAYKQQIMDLLRHNLTYMHL